MLKIFNYNHPHRIQPFSKHHGEKNHKGKICFTFMCHLGITQLPNEMNPEPKCQASESARENEIQGRFKKKIVR